MADDVLVRGAPPCEAPGRKLYDVVGVPRDDMEEAAYRVAAAARNRAERLPDLADASPEAFDEAAIRIVEMARNVLQGRRPTEDEGHRAWRAPGATQRDWEPLTGQSIETLIFVVRHRRISIAIMKRAHKLGLGPKPPHSGSRLQCCLEVLGEFLISKEGEKNESRRRRIRECAASLESIIKVRDREIGWKTTDKRIIETFYYLVEPESAGRTVADPTARREHAPGPKPGLPTLSNLKLGN